MRRESGEQSDIKIQTNECCDQEFHAYNDYNLSFIQISIFNP